MFSDDFFFVKPKHPCERHLQPRYAGIHLPQLRLSASVPIWEAGTAAMAEVAGGITVATIECDGEIVCEAPAIAHEKLGFVSGNCNSPESSIPSFRINRNNAPNCNWYEAFTGQ